MKKWLKLLQFIIGIIIIASINCNAIIADDFEELDLTENVITPPDHIHRYITAFDANKDGYHYQKCNICGIIDDSTKVKHNFVESYITLNPTYSHTNPTYGDSAHGGNNGYRCHWTTTLYNTCNCGYSYAFKDPHTLVQSPNPVRQWYYSGNIHYSQMCTTCGYSGLEASQCKDSNGIVLNCQHTGTCATCGKEYDSTTHDCYNIRQTFNYTDLNGNKAIDIKCSYCNKIIFKLRNVKFVHDSSTSKIKIDFDLDQSGECKELGSITSGGSTFIYGWFRNNDASWLKSYSDVTKTGNHYTMINEYRRPFQSDNIIQNIELRILNESTRGFGGININNAIIPDTVAPEIKDEDITISGIQKKIDAQGKEWVILQTFNLKGKENLSDIVNLYIDIDSNGSKKRYYTGILPVDSSSRKFSQSITPPIEVTSGNIIFTFVDRCNNQKVITKVLPSSDNFAPEFKNGTDFTTEWKKEKILTINTEDKGSGKVQITINNKNKFTDANKNGDMYSKSYKLTGDVYSEINPIAYAQDDLLNMSYQTLKVNRIDNTNPTITQVNKEDQTNGQVKVNTTSNDLHITKGEGSGVKKYKIKRVN